MLEIYLPIAQVNIDIFLLLFLSLAVGVLSGLFGVGGGFLMTPFLIFMGIPPVYAVPNEVNNILATSDSGSLSVARSARASILLSWRCSFALGALSNTILL